MVGSATLTTDVSMALINTPKMTASDTSHLFSVTLFREPSLARIMRE
jgi:hypothetical protein